MTPRPPLNEWLSLYGLVDSTESAISYTYLDAGGEQDVFEDTGVTRRICSIAIDLNAMTQNGTIRIYRKEDGSNYRIWIEETVTAAGAEKIWTKNAFRINQHWKLTYEEAVDEGADRSIPGNVITEEKE